MGLQAGGPPRIRARRDRLEQRERSLSHGVSMALEVIGINMIDVLLESVLVCPVCGFAKRETMPTDACQIFYECVSCKTVLRPKPGDCCVFCSYGSVKCPPMQGENCNNCAAE
jgi:hypothetical protein